MNRRTACEILDIDNDTDLDIEIVKKKYRIMALIYHPDKNHSPDACDKFRDIRDAYEFLSNDKSQYMDICRDFVKSIDKNTLIDAYKMMNVCGDALRIPRAIISKILAEKMRRDEIVCLHPSIDDLLEDNVYKLVVNNHVYLIPLWHHELVYDNSGSDLYVKCKPTLPSDMYIDEYNNIQMSVRFYITDIFERDILSIFVGKREFKIERDKLLCKSVQSITYNDCGIPIIKPNSTYDVSKRGNITFIIHLEKTI